MYSRTIRNNTISISSLLLVFISWSASAQDVTMGTLLQEMIARENMAIFPQPSFELKQFSSYDRNAKVPGGEEWFANRDHTEFLRLERTENGEEWVLFDADAPGAIVRWWMTFGGFEDGAGEGILRIYIDGKEIPEIEGTAYDVMSGGVIAVPPLSTSVSESTPYNRRGHNIYLPIPYGKSCKITYQSEKIETNDKGERTNNALAIYYVINYREYSPGTSVESFNKDLYQKYTAELMKAQSSLSWPFTQLFSDPPSKTMQLRKLEPGESLGIDLDGSQYIKAIKMRLTADNVPHALRTSVISLQFDGTSTLKIPVGEFFGTGYQVNPHETYYTRVYSDGTMVSAWPMPFQSNAKIEMTNMGDENVTIHNLHLYTDDWVWDERSMYFGGSWKQFYQQQTGGPDDPKDLIFNELNGKGVYAGDLITLFNSVAAWWGEGDEKIYVDGESFPSHFGTGTEDYYGYAWGRPEEFDHPFIAQPDGSGNLDGGTIVNIRYRALDKIPFNESLKMSMELWHWRDTKVNYAPTTFFYLRPGGNSNVELSATEVKKPLAFSETPQYDPYMVEGKIQGEAMEPVRIDGGVLTNQRGKLWDGGLHVWWRTADKDDVLSLQFTSDKSYADAALELQLTKAKDYGIVEVTINEEKPVTFDGYATEVSVETIEISNVTLRKGLNKLQVVVKGKNDKALDGNMFGIDYLKVK